MSKPAFLEETTTHSEMWKGYSESSWHEQSHCFLEWVLTTYISKEKHKNLIMSLWLEEQPKYFPKPIYKHMPVFSRIDGL